MTIAASALDFANPHEAKRAEPRTNLFLMATIVVAGAVRPVRIRNLSAHGALIETANLPATGTRLSLRRGNLSVDAQLMWADERRGGISFTAPIALAGWLPFGPGVSRGQARVDRIIAQTREDLAARQRAAAESAGDPLHRHVAAELATLARQLGELGAELGRDPAQATRAEEIAAAVQMLGHFGRLLDRDCGQQDAGVIAELQSALERRHQAG